MEAVHHSDPLRVEVELIGIFSHVAARCDGVNDSPVLCKVDGVPIDGILIETSRTAFAMTIIIKLVALEANELVIVVSHAIIFIA